MVFPEEGKRWSLAALLGFWSLWLLIWGASSAQAEKVLSEAYFKNLFLKTLAAKLPWPLENMEVVRVAAEPVPVRIPAGAVEKVRLQHPAQPGSNTLLVDYYHQDRLLTRVRVVGYLEVYLPVAVLVRPVSRGTLLSQEMVRLEPRPLTRLPHDVITDLSSLKGKRLRYSLPAGRVLRRSQIEDPPLVRRRQIVKIVARSPFLVVTAQGEARQDGRRGEIIRVRNLSSKKEIYARVVGPNTVEVSF